MHVTFSYCVITGVYLYTYIFGKIIAGNTICLSHLFNYSSLCNHWKRVYGMV